MLYAVRRMRSIAALWGLSAFVLAGGTVTASAETARRQDGGIVESETVQMKPEARLPLMVGAVSPALLPRSPAPAPRDTTEVKRMAREAATAHAIPIDYFLRLINQESGFNERAISRAGAQGIAQFMPGTAAMRGLKNPFDPAEALPKSAALLKDLTRQFGNVGLAAAAYNCGATCVGNWLAGRGRLPLETRSYVLAITGRPVQDWAPAEIRLREATGIPTLQGETARRAKAYHPSNWELDLLRSLTAKPAPPAQPGQPKIKLAGDMGPTGSSRRRNVVKPSLESMLCSTCVIQASY